MRRRRRGSKDPAGRTVRSRRPFKYEPSSQGKATHTTSLKREHKKDPENMYSSTHGR